MLGITILGNNSALPAFGRHPTAQVVTVADEVFLVDCGEGTQIRLAHFKVKRSRITRIFISHLHGDHFYGLIGLLNTMNLLNRETALHIHGPEAIEKVISLQLELAQASLRFPVHFHINPENGGIIYQGGTTLVSCFPVKHRIPCWGYRFDVVRSPRKIIPEKAVELGIPTAFFRQLARGEDYVSPDGHVVANALVTQPAPKPPSYAFCADTLYLPELVPYVQGVHTLYHEATYLEAAADKAEARFHSTARQAAQIAQQAGVQQLLIGHFSSRYEALEPFLEEASTVFPKTALALEGVTYLVRTAQVPATSS